MSNPTETADAHEADDMGERPDRGRTPDTIADSLVEALQGTDSGSDTRAGSLEGGSSSGSDDDPDQDIINETLASEGMASADPQSPSSQGVGAIKPVDAPGKPDEDPAEGKRD